MPMITTKPPSHQASGTQPGRPDPPPVFCARCETPNPRHRTNCLACGHLFVDPEELNADITRYLAIASRVVAGAVCFGCLMGASHSRTWPETNCWLIGAAMLFWFTFRK